MYSRHLLVVFLLALLSSVRNQDSFNCQNITCFGNSDCVFLRNNTKCLVALQKPSVDEMIRINLNVSDENDSLGNVTIEGLNSTSASSQLSALLMITVPLIGDFLDCRV